VYLVDTSVLIHYLRGRKNVFTEKLQFLIDQGIPYGINEIIYAEVLQGAKHLKEFRILKEFLGSQRFYSFRSEVAFYEDAAKIYLDCRRKGITVSSIIDCLIAQNTLDYDLILLHDDQDYIHIAKVRPLKLIDI